MKYFEMQWKIGNISDMFLQYFVLCGFPNTIFLKKFIKNFTGLFIKI